FSTRPQISESRFLLYTTMKLGSGSSASRGAYVDKVGMRHAESASMRNQHKGLERQPSLSVEEGGGEAERNYQESVVGFSSCRSGIFVSSIWEFVGSLSTVCRKCDALCEPGAR